MKKSEDSLRDLRHNQYLHYRNSRKRREKGAENLVEEIMAENFTNLGKETNIQIHEALKVPNKMNPNRPTPRPIIIKLSKVKDKGSILKAAREKQLVLYKGTPIRLKANFSAETLQAKREWHDIFKVLKEKKCQPRILYLAKLSFRIERDIKSFAHKQKLKEFITTRLALE